MRMPPHLYIYSPQLVNYLGKIRKCGLVGEPPGVGFSLPAACGQDVKPSVTALVPCLSASHHDDQGTTPVNL